MMKVISTTRLVVWLLELVCYKFSIFQAYQCSVSPNPYATPIEVFKKNIVFSFLVNGRTRWSSQNFRKFTCVILISIPMSWKNYQKEKQFSLVEIQVVQNPSLENPKRWGSKIHNFLADNAWHCNNRCGSMVKWSVVFVKKVFMTAVKKRVLEQILPRKLWRRNWVSVFPLKNSAQNLQGWLTWQLFFLYLRYRGLSFSFS